MKRFIVSHPEYGWQAEFDVDMQKAARPCLKSLECFGDPLTRADDSAEETVKTFLKFLAPTLMDVSLEHGRVSGEPDMVIQELARTTDEYPALDGSDGLTLVYCDTWGIDFDDFEVVSGEETKGTAGTQGGGK